jgi:hypothetical protein
MVLSSRIWTVVVAAGVVASMPTPEAFAAITNFAGFAPVNVTGSCYS